MGTRVTPRDRGSMLVLTSCVGLAMSAAVLAAVVPFAGRLLDAQRAQVAADAAALAGVTGGRTASVRLAASNGAVLTSWSLDGDQVTVTVVVDEATATARATDGP